jgi:hypothetical protein
MFTKELRAWELAITQTLQSDFYNSDQTEIDNFLNSVRAHLVGKVSIGEGADSPVSIVFAPAIALSTPSSKKPHPNQKLTEDDLKFIHENKDMTAASLSRTLKVSDVTIARVRRGLSHTDVELEGAEVE